MRLRTLLDTFATRRRTLRRVAEIAEALERVGLAVEPVLTVELPTSVRVTLRSRRPGAISGNLSGRVAALADPARRRPVAELEQARTGPGVYAWWARDDAARTSLGLSESGGARPLYVGVSSDLPRRLRSYVSRHKSRDGLRGGLALWLSEVDGSLPRWFSPLPPLHGYAEDALTGWIQRHLSLSWISLPSGSVAVAVEREAIRALDPLLNRRLVALPADAVEWFSATFVKGDELRRARGDWHLEVLRWAASHHRMLGALEPGDRRWFRVSDAGQIGTRIPKERAARAARVIEVSGDLLHPLPGAFLRARPDSWYSATSKRAHGEPPDWRDVRDSLTPAIQRAVVLWHYLSEPPSSTR